MPEQVYDFVHREVDVRPCKKREVGLVVLDDPDPPRMRWISITFRNDEPRTGGGLFHYTTAKSEGQNPDGSFRMVFDVFNETPLDKATYDGWVEQSINRTIANRLQDVGDELVMANRLGIPYLTESQFESELLSKVGVEGDVSATTPISFLDANLPFLPLDDPELVVRLRSDNAEMLGRLLQYPTAQRHRSRVIDWLGYDPDV